MRSNNPRGTCPIRWRWHRLPPLLGALLGLATAGCHHDDFAPYAEWIPSHPSPVRRGAFAELRQVGAEAEAAVRGLQRRAAPSARDVKAMDAKLAPLMESVAKACAGPVLDDYVPEASLTPDLSRIGWAALGGAYERRLRAAVARRDFEEAARVEAEGTRFAMIISCGDASDALVAYPIADSLRRTIAPSLRDLEAGQLSKLAASITAALMDRLPPEAVAVHEHLAMLAGVQAVQDAYRDGHLAELGDRFGLTTRDAIDALQKDKGTAESKRAAFFAAMAADADAEAKWLARAVTTPLSQRTPEPNPKPTSKAPWHALSRQFVLAGGAMLSAGDLTLARTRLFALTCDLFAIGKTSGAVPRDLHLFPADLNKDPYTNRPFYYVPEGLDFRLYSAGPDGVDNSGDTDETGTTPDLFLEGFY